MSRLAAIGSRLYSGRVARGRVADPAVVDEADVKGATTFGNPRSCSMSVDRVDDPDHLGPT